MAPVIAPAEVKPELDKYELFEEIGHGGMATVYRAHDRRLGRDVAVKVIHPHLRQNKEIAARFVSEAHAVAKVKHPNIVEVYDVSDEDDQERYLVVELVRGTTLRRLLKECGHLPTEIGAIVALEVAAALEHAHQQGVVHRDVKPENVLVSLQSPKAPDSSNNLAPQIKITDFGIAKLLDAQGVTSTGQVLGSPAHMAPEQIEAGAVTGRADVFGLGVMLYECVVGKLPFDGSNPAQVLRRVLDGTFTPAERARPSVGARYSKLIEKALARDPERRFASAGEFGEALRAELAALGFTAPRRELSEYLTDPEGYEKRYDDRIVKALMEQGRAARAQREVSLAAAHFNRALAYRPDDPDLMANVAGLARLERLKAVLSRAVPLVLVALLLGVVGLFGLPALRSQPQEHESGRLASGAGKPADPATRGSKTSAAEDARRNAALERGARPEPDASARGAKPGERSSPAVSEIAPPSRRPAPEVKPPEKRERELMIVVNGPQSATVKIDGVEKSQWFGVRFWLAPGPHSFEFIPPNETCCGGPTRQTVEVIEAEEGAEPQKVVGVIDFRPALLVLEAASGTQATCGELGTFSEPGRLQIQMSQPIVRGQCTVIPPLSAPKQIDVTLKAGEVFTISEP